MNFVVIGLLFLIAQPLPVQAIDSPQIDFDRALQLSRDGNYSEALHQWNDFIHLYPNNALALSNRGNVRLALGDPQGAISDQTKSINLLPLEEDSHFNRGSAEEALNLWDEAEKDYKWIIDRNPNDAIVLYRLANVFQSKGEWKDASDLFYKASLAREYFLIASSRKALVDYELGHLQQAESELRSIIRKNPMFADARAGLTALLWKKGFIGEAESNWTAAAGLDSRYVNSEWLLESRHWPPKAVNDLMSFVALERP